MTAITPQDINKYITMIRINFESAYKTHNDTEMQMLIRSWYEILKVYPKEVCDKAVINAIKNAEFAPRIGSIVKEIERMRTAYEKTDTELWTELTSALPEVGRIMYFGTAKSYYNGRLIDPLEEVYKIYNALDPILQEFVGGISGLVTLSKQATLEYEKGRFLKTVGTLKERGRTKQETPLGLAGIIQGLSVHTAIEGGNTKLLEK